MSFTVWRNSLSIITLLSLAVLLIYRPSQPQPVTGTGTTVPATTIFNAHSQSRTLPTLTRGRVSVINFWATWCPACKAELPTLNSYRWGAVRLILISSGNPGYTGQVLSHYSTLRGHSYYDRSNVAFSQFLVTTLPTSFFINAQGKIVARIIGPLSPALLRRTIMAAAKS